MSTLQVKPIGYALGAEVTGVDLRRPIEPALKDAINEAWLRHLVLVFPGQDLSTTEQIAFSRCFGELDKHEFQPRYTHPDHREILMITNKLVDGKPSDTRNTGRNLDQVPVLGDIPILGILFQRRRASDTRSELVIFLTPRIVNRAEALGR